MKKDKKQKISYSQISKIVLTSFLISITLFASSVKASPITEENLVILINNERESRGLTDLNVDPELTVAARLKSRHMLNRNYFAHYAFGLTPWIFIQNSGYDYMLAGENLAMDFNTSEGVVRAWMASPKHRDNILNPEFEDMGIGIVQGAYTENGSAHETTMITNMFGTKKPAIVRAVERVRSWFRLF